MIAIRVDRDYFQTAGERERELFLVLDLVLSGLVYYVRPS